MRSTQARTLERAISFDIAHCALCPRVCGADRTTKQGFCGGGGAVRVARAALHFWEEPCISGTSGSGTVFFSGCPLRCCYCQNHDISIGNFGKEITVSRLGEIFLELQAQGAHNINLVNPTHYVPWILQALKLLKNDLVIPIVYNSGGYERIETLKMLEGWVDVYLPDLKYRDAEKAGRYSDASDYFEVASRAVREMVRQTGQALFDESGLLVRGTVVRHLVLPNNRQDSVRILEWIRETFGNDQVLVSLMSQYTPFYRSTEYPEINRRVSTFEYNRVLDKLIELDLTNGYVQERSSAKEEYTPEFDLSGV